MLKPLLKKNIGTDITRGPNLLIFLQKNSATAQISEQ
jgi:hypothetical protein